MLGVLVWKELLEHLRSLRFALSFVTIVGLFVLGAAVWNVRIAEERQGYRLGVEEYEESIRETAGDLGALQGSEFRLWLPSSGLTFAAGGYGRSLPNVAVMHEAKVHGFEQRSESNPVLFRIDPDWVFIAGTLATLMALLLTYDGVAGEKERGCLRQLLANRVPRDQILIAKYLASLAMVAAPVLTGAVSAVAIIQLIGQGLSNNEWTPLAAVMVAALLCVSAFLWLGLWGSSRTHNSTLALLASLVLWSLFAVFLPQAGVLAGEYFVDVPNATVARVAAMRAGLEEKDYWEAVRAEDRAQHHYRDLLLQQVEVAQRATLMSPVAALSLASEALTVTGVVRHRVFVEQAHAHRGQFADFLRREGIESHGVYRHLRLLEGMGIRPEPGSAGATEPVPPEGIPRFQFRPPSLRERLDAALVPLLVLVIANGVCFLGAYFSFRRYDVR